VGGFYMKKLFILVSLLILFPLMSCASVDYNTYIVDTGWEKNTQNGDTFIIDSLDEFNEYLATDAGQVLLHSDYKLLDSSKYNETYFEENALVFAFVGAGSGSLSYNVKKVNFNDGVLDIKLKKYTPRAVTGDITLWTVMLEMTKEEASSIVDTKIIVKKDLIRLF
jgi:hypothetical protein